MASGPPTSTTSSAGLTLREQLRLQAQQKLRSQPKSISSSEKTTSVSQNGKRKRIEGPRSQSSNDEADEDDDDDNDIGLLSLRTGRSQRKAALNRPATYSIDPIDDGTRLKSHPTKSLKLLAGDETGSKKPSSSISTLLREKERRSKKGTDEDGFSRAEAIAEAMEQDRLAKAGFQTNSAEQHNAVDTGRASQATSDKPENGDSQVPPDAKVSALSPTIPSFIWSSQSDVGDDDCERDAESTMTGSPKKRSKLAEDKLAKSLIQVAGDEEEGQRAYAILRRDGVASSLAVSSFDNTTTRAGHRGMPSWKEGRAIKPSIDVFAKPPNVFEIVPSSEGEAASSSCFSASSIETSSVDDDTDIRQAWEAKIWPHFLLANTISPGFNFGVDQLKRIVVWAAISFVLELEANQAHLIAAFFSSLVFDHHNSTRQADMDVAVPKGLSKVLRQVPRLLTWLGVRGDVLETCFPEYRDIVVFSETRHRSERRSRKQKKKGRSCETSSSNFLTYSERDQILINLSRVLEMVVTAFDPTSLYEQHTSLLAGAVSCLAVLVAASTNFTLQAQIGCLFQQLLSLDVEEHLSVQLQSTICDRLLKVPGIADSLALKARLILAFPGDGVRIQAIRRWVAFAALTEHIRSQVEMEQLRYHPWSIELQMLESVIEPADPGSPFYVSTSVLATRTATSSPASAASPQSSDSTVQTNFEILLAATSLIAVVLRDVPVQMCTLDRLPSAAATLDSDRSSTLTPLSSEMSSPAPNIKLEHQQSSIQQQHKTSNPSRRALRLAMTPYKSLTPIIDPSRIKALKRITNKLVSVNNKIRDNQGDVILRSTTKDVLQRTCHSLEYQLEMFDLASTRAAGTDEDGAESGAR